MDEKRDKKIEIRVTEKEKNHIKERAYKNYLSVSDYSRLMLIKGEINLISVEEIKHLKKIGNNLNQITKFMYFSNDFRGSELENLVKNLSEKIDNLKNDTTEIEK